MRYPVVHRQALGGWVGTPAPMSEPISTHPLLGKWQPHGWKFWERKKKPRAAAQPAPAGGAGTTPAGGAGTTPAGGAGTTPAGGAGTTPAGGVGTTPAGGAGTTPAGGAGTMPSGAGTMPGFGPDEIGPMLGPIPTQPMMAPQAPGASPWPGYGSPIGMAPPAYGGGIPAQPMPAPALMPPSQPMACANVTTPKPMEQWVEDCPGVKEARGY